MYECSVCQRTYKTQTSLTRHARNHNEDLASGHCCDLCGTSFARRDILSRHQQVAHGESSQQRKRCHTACEGCREARIRCDGGDPCSPCVASNRGCQYSHMGRRVSKPSANRTSRTADTHDHDVAQRLEQLTPQTSIVSHASDGTSHLGGRHDSSALLPDPFPTIDEPGPEWPAIDLDGLSWPWVHETLFLHDYTSGMQDPGTRAGEPANCSIANDPFNPARVVTDPVTSTPDVSSALNNEIDILISHATEASLGTENLTDHVQFWKNAASRLQPLLGEDNSVRNDRITPSNQIQTPHMLHRVILEQYVPNFNRLWPMFLEAELQPDSLHAVLYLVLVSIGSMYGNSIQKQFGISLHKRLRRLLVGSLFELENPDGNQVWMAQARLLTQVQGLYFGQPQGFSYAQHLGAILVAQARRLELFQQPARLKTNQEADDALSGRERLDKWLQSEIRNRLAFGILRADVFTSVLLNSRPLLSFEEIDLFTPCSDDLWRDMEGLSVTEKLVAIRIEDRHYAPIMFSDVLRLLLDRMENAPTMRAISHELCLFGLQAPIWKVSHDPDLFQRLTGGKYVRRRQSSPKSTRLISKESHKDTEHFQMKGDRVMDHPMPMHDMLTGSSGHSSDALTRNSRAMHDMQSDRDRVEEALEKWHQGFQSVRSPALTQHRDTLMSCMLLWHTSYLRLYAPLHQLHDVSYRTGERQTANTDSTKQAESWARGKEACIAASRAVKICHLIYLELERPVGSRACFNLLAFASLHHAAVVLWTLSETRDDFSFLENEQGSISFSRMLSLKDTPGLLKACANLFRMLSPMGGVSFGLAADRLSSARFPTRHE